MVKLTSVIDNVEQHNSLKHDVLLMLDSVLNKPINSKVLYEIDNRLAVIFKFYYDCGDINEVNYTVNLDHYYRSIFITPNDDYTRMIFKEIGVA